MVKGGTNFRKKAQGRYKKRRAPPVKKTVAVVEDMVVDSIVDPRIIGEMDGIAAGPLNQTISESKVEDIPLPNVTEDFIAPTGYRFMDMSILDSVFGMVSCPQCFCTSLNLVENRKQGLAFELKLVCSGSDCDWCHIFWTSKKKARNYDVNRRIFYSMRRTGNGYNGMKRFLLLMNHPPPMTEKNYRKLSTIFRNSVKHVAESVMKDAAL